MKIKDFKNNRAMFLLPAFVVGLFILPYLAIGQTRNGLSPAELKKLSLEELFNLEVTSVSKSPEKLTGVASAIQVIMAEDIRRSTATSLPEALRLAPNLQVAELNSYATIISARGFNALYSNKLLVMIDGRTVYSPLFAGVFWDVQHVMLEDIERIEVISGPGGSLWEANAVNGVINVITKKAHETQGIYAAAAIGTYLEKKGALRYGGKIGSNLSYRLYAQHMNRDNTFSEGAKADDEWRFTQSGFRVDWEPSEENTIMFQGNFYLGKEFTRFQDTIPMATPVDGQNVLGRWTHTFPGQSKFVAQVYFDRTWRRMPTISFQLNTYDIDLQHGFRAGERHNILLGAGYRFMKDETLNYTTRGGILPNKRNMSLFSAFVQDEITLAPDRLKLTVGTKLLHNFFSGFEIQPGVRSAWTPNDRHTIWGAVSRAVRTPSRIDVDYYIPINPAPGFPHVAGGPNFDSEKVIAFEMGYRTFPLVNLSVSLATFYNVYDDLYSVDPIPSDPLEYQIQNGSRGRSWGAEFSGTCQPMANWRLKGGYTYFRKNLESKPGSTNDLSSLGRDARNQVLIQSILDLPLNFQCDVTARYLGELSDAVPEYFTFDARLAWLYKDLELSVAGQNLFEHRHIEWATEIPRGVYGKITWRYQK